MTLEQSLKIAVGHHQAGRLSQAEPIYRQILAQQPNHAEALHRLGVIAAQVGRNDAALELIRQSLNVNPANPETYNSLGITLQAAGQIDEAIAACRTAVALRDDYAQAHYNLGRALGARGLLEEAISAYRRSLELKPGLPEAHINLGILFKDQGNLEQAVAEYRKAIALNPNYAQAYSNLGNILKSMGQVDQAIGLYRHAIGLKPDFADAHGNLANALVEKGKTDEAIVLYRRTIALDPAAPKPFSNLGVLLQGEGRLDEAMAIFRQTVAVHPRFAIGHNNLGAALQARGDHGQAIACFRQAISCNPTFADAHRNLALALLAREEFAEGWAEYEWRWKAAGLSSPAREFSEPMWNGKPLKSTTLLLYGEQGFGDTIQFIRYLPLVRRLCPRFVVECQVDLARLIRQSTPDCPVIAQGDPLPAFDVQCPLMSIPYLLDTNLENIAGSVPYLAADPELAANWRARLAPDAKACKVGIVWGGSKTHLGDGVRSMALSDFAPLGRLPGFRFYSLQKGEPRRQLLAPGPGLDMVDWADDLHDFADTAAMISNLDLVISVDTSVVHLAGAMGKPVWVLLAYVPDWRWRLHGEQSPWYPTARLFRQSTIGDWQSVIRRVAESLPAHAAACGR